MSTIFNFIYVIGIIDLPSTSTDLSIHLQRIETRKILIIDNSTGVVRSCTGSHCYRMASTVLNKKIILYIKFVHFIYDMIFIRENDEDQTVTAKWYYGNNRCNNRNTGTVRRYQCQSLANVIFIVSPSVFTNVVIRGFATYFENYIGCYYMNFHGINKTVAINVNVCMKRCKSRRWIGLSGKTSSGVLCSCFLSLDFGASSVNEEYCDCRHGAFNFDILCGGSEGYVSVYSTSRRPMWMDNNVTEMCIYTESQTGDCVSCVSGKMGDRCHLIDCNIREGCTGQLNVFTISTSVCGCRCEDGHYMTQNFNCHEADECLMEPCGEGVSRCINTPGSYNCECLEGYILDIICEDIDECIEMEEECRLRNRTCQNTPGSYICSCEIGYMFIDGSCKDIDECLNPVCGRLSAACINTIGSYTCYCSAGFTEGVGGACFDIDECTNISLCNTNNSLCRNTHGNFECNCLPGFLKIRPETPKGQCEDQDECNNTIDTCGLGVYCANIPGSFLCYCPSGMKLSSYQYSKECKDIDECINIAICNTRRSFCLNLPESYACVCHPGFVNVDSLNCERDNSSNTTIDDYDTTSNPDDELNGLTNWMYTTLYTIIGIIALIILKYVFTLRVKSRQEAEAIAAEITSSKLSTLS